MCVLVGRPPAEDWQERQLELAAAMHGAAERMSFAHADEVHRRGNYRLKSHGLSHGGGQKVRLFLPSHSSLASLISFSSLGHSSIGQSTKRSLIACSTSRLPSSSPTYARVC